MQVKYPNKIPKFCSKISKVYSPPPWKKLFGMKTSTFVVTLDFVIMIRTILKAAEMLAQVQKICPIPSS